MTRRLIMVSEEQRTELLRFLEMAPKFSGIFTLLAVGALFFAGPSFALLAGGFFGLAAVAAALLVFSWRHYNYWWSWTIWGVPLLIGGSTLFTFAALPLVRVGSLHPLAVLLGTFGFGGLGLFGPLFLLRSRIREWYGL